MRSISINLPAKHRLSVNLVKARGNLDGESLLPNVGNILRAKKGSKISRYFRHVFEHKRIKRLLGRNLAALMFAFSVFPINSTVEAFNDGSDIITTEAPIVLTTEFGVHNPVKEIKLTQGYKIYHPGIDLDGVTGDPINPIMNGTVVNVEYSRFGYGKNVIIEHEEGYSSLYAHLSKIYVVDGQNVTTATTIGEMGATGRAFGDHLHLEVYKDGKAVNPLAILPKGE